MNRKDSTQSLLSFFFLLNLFFLSLQILFVYQHAGNFVTSIPMPWHTYEEIGLTVLTHIALNFALAALQLFLLLGILNRSQPVFKTDSWIIIIWLLSTITILSANVYFFPLSRFSMLVSPPIPPIIFKWILIVSLCLLVLLCINSMLTQRKLTATSILLLIVYVSFENLHTHNDVAYKGNQPNIVIIGIDSLSPESINRHNMPFVSELLQHSTQFTNAISPLARTYPAWVSILTGLYPLHHQGAENLIPKNQVNTQASIAWQLQKQGYHTVFATDDRRFNSIDKEFGFEKIIGPKLGVNDVIIGTFNDFPLSNLLVNFRISSWLFPYNYINRASFHTYYPDSFSTLLEQELSQNKTHSPLFLAVHFTLPHWPYAWAESSPRDVNNEFSLLNRNTLYQHALHRVDQQVHSFIVFLKHQRYLENSMLIVLSDHGETLYYPNSRNTTFKNYRGDRPSPLAHYFQHHTATALDKSAGHGSDLLSPKQYHSVLGFYLYNQGIITTLKTQVHQRVALIDLAPTILEFTKTTGLQTFDGISLYQNLKTPHAPLPQRYFYIESGMFPNQKISKEKAMKIGKIYYQVNPKTDELEIREDKFTVFDQQKLYGVLYGNWVYVVYPNGSHYIPVIQNLNNNEWTDKLNSPFAKNSPAQNLANEVKKFYKEKIYLPTADH